MDAGARGPLIRGEDGVALLLKVKPGARRDAVDGPVEEAGGERRLQLRVTAAAEAGKANRALLAFLAKRWRLSRAQLEIVSGLAGRRKRLLVRGDPAALEQRLRELGDL